MSAYIFIGLTESQVAAFIDPRAIDAEAIRAHAFSLLRKHARAVSVEIWQDKGLVSVIDRAGIRPFPAQGGGGGETAAQRGEARTPLGLGHDRRDIGQGPSPARACSRVAILAGRIRLRTPPNCPDPALNDPSDIWPIKASRAPRPRR